MVPHLGEDSRARCLACGESHFGYLTVASFLNMACSRQRIEVAEGFEHFVREGKAETVVADVWDEPCVQELRFWQVFPFLRNLRNSECLVGEWA